MSIASLLIPLELQARMKGRSYWRLRFTDGRVVDEREIDWSLAPTRGRLAIQLVCPDGRVAELGNSRDASDRLFQLKGARLMAGHGSRTDFHLIGIVTGLNGECRCGAWEYGPGRLVTFEDNVFAMRYAGIGALSPDVLGIKPD